MDKTRIKYSPARQTKGWNKEQAQSNKRLNKKYNTAWQSKGWNKK
jgi:hypothetical protein